MSYYILAKLPEGELLQVSSEPLQATVDGHIVKIRDGEIPDLNKYEWHPGSLAFMEKNTSRFLTQEAFTRRLTNEELRSIYTLSKQSIDIEIWLDRFKMAKEIGLDDPFLVDGLKGLSNVGVFTSERVQEILS